MEKDYSYLVCIRASIRWNHEMVSLHHSLHDLELKDSNWRALAWQLNTHFTIADCTFVSFEGNTLVLDCWPLRISFNFERWEVLPPCDVGYQLTGLDREAIIEPLFGALFLKGTKPPVKIGD